LQTGDEDEFEQLDISRHRICHARHGGFVLRRIERSAV